MRLQQFNCFLKKLLTFSIFKVFFALLLGSTASPLGTLLDVAILQELRTTLAGKTVRVHGYSWILILGITRLD